MVYTYYISPVRKKDKRLECREFFSKIPINKGDIILFGKEFKVIKVLHISTSQSLRNGETTEPTHLFIKPCR